MNVTLDLIRRVLYRYPARLWLRHYLAVCGTHEDAQQIAARTLLERPGILKGPKPLTYASGYVASELRKELNRCKEYMGCISLNRVIGKFTGVQDDGDHYRNRIGKHKLHDGTPGVDPETIEPRKTVTPEFSDSDPFDMIAESDRELVRDWFYTPWYKRGSVAKKHNLKVRAARKRVSDAIDNARTVFG